MIKLDLLELLQIMLLSPTWQMFLKHKAADDLKSLQKLLNGGILARDIFISELSNSHANDDKDIDWLNLSLSLLKLDVTYLSRKNINPDAALINKKTLFKPKTFKLNTHYLFSDKFNILF